jgi:hypothetical protein
MRVPARFAIIVFLGLSVIVSCGALVVLSRLPAWMRSGAAGVCVLALLSESWAAPLTVYPYSPRARPADRAVAEWLSGLGPGAVLHLPISASNFQELNFQFATLIHHHPLVNGFSGYNTPLQAVLRDSAGPLHDFGQFPAVVRMLRSIDVRYVIVHVDDYNAAELQRNEHRLTLDGLRGSGQIVREQTLLDAHAFELQPWREARPRDAPEVEIDPHEMTVSVAQNEDRAPFLVDRNPDTRWVGDQSGSIWIAATFRGACDVARVELLLAERSLVDYPRELRIDSIGTRGEPRTLYESAPLPEFIAGILRHPRYPPLVLPLPPNVTARLVITAIADIPGRWWSVHELRVWRRVTRPAR